MKEVDFKDRVPTFPGRIVLTPVDGQTNTYDMERNDVPIEEGTPLDKATFNSFLQSRLTGRYYVPTVSKNIAAVSTYTVSPIPTSGWTETGTEKATNGLYVTTASLSQTNPAEAFDGTWSTNSGWRPAFDDAEPWIAVDLGSPIVLKKIRIDYTSDAWATTCVLEGSNNGSAWTYISERERTDNTAEWSFNNTAAYQHYRLRFNNTGVRLYGWALTAYDVTTYRNAFTVSDVFPSSWTEGQIALVEIPRTAATLGVVGNTINGIMVNTILQPARRYELRYTNSAFVAKEV